MSSVEESEWRKVGDGYKQVLEINFDTFVSSTVLATQDFNEI